MRTVITDMRQRARSERGFTLIEVLVAASLMIVVLGATLGALDNTSQIQRRTEKSNDQQEIVRTTMDRMAAQLRNLASPSTSTAKTIDRATSYDLIFQTTDPSKQWVRYCLADGTNDPPSFSGFHASSAQNERIWYQTPTGAFNAQGAAPSTNSSMVNTCPGPPVSSGTAGWSTAQIVSDRITNKINSQDRPLFKVNGSPTTDTSTVTFVIATAFGNWSTAVNNPKETHLTSGVYLRNQNQPPTAAIQTTRTGASYTLNGTTSSDPEGRTLSSFLWFKGPPNVGTPTASMLPSCVGSDTSKTTTGVTWTCFGSGALLSYTFQSSDATGGQVGIALQVTDPGGLTGVASVTGSIT
jgi:Tfp pilus assembly protein PilV